MVPGMRFNKSTRMWEGYADACIETSYLLKQAGVVVDNAVLSPEVGQSILPIASKDRRSYQLEAVNFLIARGGEGCFLADTMGLGKTCSALTAARAVSGERGHVLVVTPSYARGVWWEPSRHGEIGKWWPAAAKKVDLPSGVRRPQPFHVDTQVVVIHYDILAAWEETLKSWGFDVVCFDEIHMGLQGETSKRSKAARNLAALARFRWGLSGTPMPNRVKNLHNIIETLSPGRLGSFFSFGVAYCNGHQEQVTPVKTVWNFDGASRTEELSRRLSRFMLRRTALDVALEIPKKQRQVIYIDAAKQGKARTNWPTGGKAIRLALARATDRKLEAGLETILGHLVEGKKVLVGTYRREVAEIVEAGVREAGFETGLVHGGVTGLRRGKAISRLKAASEAFCLVATIDSTATGIDLSAASVGVMLELTYEPHELLQWEARMARFGQRAEVVLIQYLIGRGTVDEIVASKVIAKLDDFEKVIGSTGESLSSDLTAEVEKTILDELFLGVGE